MKWDALYITVVHFTLQIEEVQLIRVMKHIAVYYTQVFNHNCLI